MGAVQLAATLCQYRIQHSEQNLYNSVSVSMAVVDRAGRRTLLILSGLVMAVSLGGLALYLSLLPSLPTSYTAWVPLLCTVTAFIGYSLGFANIPFLIMGELFPARYRSLASLSSTFNLTQLFLVLKFYESLKTSLQPAGVFW